MATSIKASRIAGSATFSLGASTSGTSILTSNVVPANGHRASAVEVPQVIATVLTSTPATKMGTVTLGAHLTTSLAAGAQISITVQHNLNAPAGAYVVFCRPDPLTATLTVDVSSLLANTFVATVKNTGTTAVANPSFSYFVAASTTTTSTTYTLALPPTLSGTSSVELTSYYSSATPATGATTVFPLSGYASDPQGYTLSFDYISGTPSTATSVTNSTNLTYNKSKTDRQVTATVRPKNPHVASGSNLSITINERGFSRVASTLISSYTVASTNSNQNMYYRLPSTESNAGLANTLVWSSPGWNFNAVANQVSINNSTLLKWPSTYSTSSYNVTLTAAYATSAAITDAALPSESKTIAVTERRCVIFNAPLNGSQGGCLGDLSFFSSDNDSSCRNLWACGRGGDSQLGRSPSTRDAYFPQYMGTGSTSSSSSLNSGTGNIRQIAVGTDHVLALDANGSVYSWGLNDVSQLGDGGTTTRSLPVKLTDISLSGTQITTIPTMTAISAGHKFSAAIGANGKLYIWGSTPNGSINTRPTEFRSSITAVACGYGHAIFVSSASSGFFGYNVYAVGSNSSGQLGTSSTTNYTTAALISVSSIVAVAAGTAFSVALSSSGYVYVWGSNASGQLGNASSASNSLSPICISNGNVTNSPFSVGAYPIVAIACGSDHVLALNSNGQLYAWGSNQYGQCGTGSTAASLNLPTLVNGATTDSPISSGTFIVSMGCGQFHSMAMDVEGNVYTWGRNNFGQLAVIPVATRTTSSLDFAPLPTKVWPLVVQSSPVLMCSLQYGVHCASSGQARVCFFRSSTGRIYAWGANEYGAIGDGSTAGTVSPIPVVAARQISGGVVASSILTSSVRIIAMAAGLNHSIAIDTQGNLYAWGRNNGGQLGNGNTTASALPTKITTISDPIPFITSGAGANLAITTNGRLYCWGNTLYAGNNTSTRQASPVLVNSDANSCSITSTTAIVNASAGTDHFVAVDSTGKVHSWGSYLNGEQGYTPITAALLVPSSALSAANGALSGRIITSVSCGDRFTLALESTGDVWAWGMNNFGQLGRGNSTATDSTVVRISGGNITDSALTSAVKIVAISAGSAHSLALDSVGKVYAWGSGGKGQIGDGSTTTRVTLPKCITGNAPANGTNALTNAIVVSRIQSFTDASMAVDNAGVLYAWGDNAAGLMRTATTTTSYLVPTVLAALT
jgi:alpha-tubulin suppressor-like RCC1 family protein